MQSLRPPGDPRVRNAPQTLQNATGHLNNAKENYTNYDQSLSRGAQQRDVNPKSTH